MYESLRVFEALRGSKRLRKSDVEATQAADADPSVGLEEFFGFRHERVIIEAVEESYRDCLRPLGAVEIPNLLRF